MLARNVMWADANGSKDYSSIFRIHQFILINLLYTAFLMIHIPRSQVGAGTRRLSSKV